jgi:hypothetical protein
MTGRKGTRLAIADCHSCTNFERSLLYNVLPPLLQSAIPAPSRRKEGTVSKPCVSCNSLATRKIKTHSESIPVSSPPHLILFPSATKRHRYPHGSRLTISKPLHSPNPSIPTTIHDGQHSLLPLHLALIGLDPPVDLGLGAPIADGVLTAPDLMQLRAAALGVERQRHARLDGAADAPGQDLGAEVRLGGEGPAEPDAVAGLGGQCGGHAGCCAQSARDVDFCLAKEGLELFGELGCVGSRLVCWVWCK